ncbi:bacterial alpha-L-rhamnosidase-domain-containing protein [Paramyrothecium foliicola]|nr:bacterial alpha-L-rhamnosidase-domain-containing protein [Paramyrothecium foliicola]
MFSRLAALLGYAVAAAASGLTIEANSLRTQGVEAPLGIHYTQPMLSWRLRSTSRGEFQSAYQIQAASSVSALDDASAWNSGKIDSSSSFAYWNGEELGSRSQVFWRVRVWDGADEASDWSEPSTFELGLLDYEEWEADWITNSEYVTGRNSLPLFAKDFDISCDVNKARLYITGLGVFRAEINGEPVSDELMGPGYSTINRTILYRAYDVTGRLQQGGNVIGVAVGKGMYNADKAMGGRYRKFQVTLKPHLVKAQLEYFCQDGRAVTVLSDGSWTTTTSGPLLEASWYGGEEFDARRIIPDWSGPGGDRSGWKKANISETGPLPGPRGELYSQTSPQLKITETFHAKTVTKTGNQYVFDFGVNFVGWFSFTMDGTGRKGERIEFWPGEMLNDAGVPDQKTTGKDIFDGYTLAGEATETFTLQFMYHGAQYIAVNTTWEPKPEDITAYVIRAANDKVSEVETSNTMLNSIHEIIDRAIKGNMYSVLTDCPHREKLGWLEQDHLAFEPLARGYDLQAYGADLMRTIADAQAQWGPEGLIPATAPEYSVFSGKWEIYRSDPNWGNAIMRFAMQHYQYYGDKKVLQDWYGVMEEYMDYLARRSNGTDLPIIDDGIGLRDWAANDKTVSIGFTNTFAYQQAAQAMKQIAAWLGRCSDAKKWKQLDGEIRTAQHKTYFKREDNQGYYDVDNQATNALALDMGAVPEEYVEEVFQSMLDEIDRFDWVFTLGEIGLPSLLRTLHKHDRDDAIFRLMTQTKKSSYGYQLEMGATSLWEHWNGTNEGGWGSLNHFMLGAGDYWLHRLSGLAPSANSVRWNVIDFAPIVVGDLTYARSTYRTPSGNASASWKLDGSVIRYDIVVPIGSKGYVTLKSTQLKESGNALRAGKNGILDVKETNGQTTVEVASGAYQFEATLS